MRNLDRKLSHANTGHVTKTAIFQNSRWRSAAILKIVLSPYFSRELSDFDQIWYTDKNFHYEHVNLTKKSKFFKFKMADGRHIENVFWLYLGAILADLCEIQTGNGEPHANTGHMTKNGNFPKFMTGDRHFDNSFRCLRHSCNELMLSSVFQ